MKLLRALVLCAVVATAGGCVFYFGGDDDCEVAVDPVGLRNPDTGACEVLGGGGGCGPVPLAEDFAWPDWGTCPSACEGLSESACLVTAGCRAAYYAWTCPPDALCESPEGEPEFWGCWSVAPSGPAPVQGSCSGLDAHACSRHDDCIAFYTDDWASAPGGTGRVFSSCADEEPASGCYSDDECPAGWDCTAETECLPPPGCDDDPDTACPAVCYGRCVPPPGPHDPGSCHGDVLCRALPPACPSGTTPGIANGCWTGYCIPTWACGPQDPGSCHGEVACDAEPPACPAGTTPGRRNGCWTGYCIPDGAC